MASGLLARVFQINDWNRSIVAEFTKLGKARLLGLRPSHSARSVVRVDKRQGVVHGTSSALPG